VAHPGDEVLRLKGLADKLIGLHRECFFRDRAVHHSGHQDDRRAGELWILLDVLADLVAIFIGHDHVGDDDVRLGLLDLSEGGGGIVAGYDVDVLAAEGDLDDLAHGGAVINEINGWRGAH
jgi:hypothetical protein